jgi:hypothetical protein
VREWLAPCVALAAAAGCAEPALFVDREADLAFYEQFAVMPFLSLADDRVAGEKLSSVFFSELLASKIAPVVDPGVLASSMMQVRGGTPATSPWSKAELAKLAETSAVQGFFEGTVREYALERSGRDVFPHISVELRLVDAATGRVVWSWSDTRRGGPAFPLWPWRETRTLGQLSAEMCRDALATLR